MTLKVRRVSYSGVCLVLEIKEYYKKQNLKEKWGYFRSTLAFLTGRVTF